jgi:ABC-type transport system involved in multi-copper enzyme maturation permease subunit
MRGLGRVVTSELTRVRRRSVLAAWLILAAVLAAMIATFVFVAAGSEGGIPQGAPGLSFPTMDQLTGATGPVAAVRSAATILGVVTLAFWAITASSDYSTGLIRLLAQAEPRRVLLLAGKVVALALVTAVATTVAVAATLVVSPALAESAGVDTSGWTVSPADLAGAVGRAWVDTYLALLVWGVVGLAIAVVTRSSTVAIAGGVGYVLVVEGLLGIAAPDVADWLPGTTLSALAQGGTAAVGFGTALALGAAYAVAGLVAGAVTVTRRDVTD